MLKWKLFCTVTMETYYEYADTEYEAKRNLAMRLRVPIYCIDVYK